MRERKKARTRQALHQAALRLFMEKGYSATTIADIAAAADVSTRTFFTYFDSKEALVYEHLEPSFVRLEHRLATRPSAGSALQETRAWLIEDFPGLPTEEVADRLLEQLTAEVPAVEAYVTKILARLEERLGAALAVDLASPPHDPTPHIVSAAAIAALYRSAVPMASGPGATVESFDRALRFIEHGLDGLRGT